MPDAAAALRADAYAILAAAFLPPTPERRQGILDATRGVLANARDEPWAPLMRSYAERLSWTGAAAEPVHVRLMEVAADGAACPPIASAYVGDPSCSWEPDPIVESLAARLGVRARRSLGARPDHLSVELEMLSLLARAEAEAEASGDAETVVRARSDASIFLARHVLVWFPKFQMAVRQQDTLGVATAAVDAARAFLEHHLEGLGARPSGRDAPPAAGSSAERRITPWVAPRERPRFGRDGAARDGA